MASSPIPGMSGSQKYAQRLGVAMCGIYALAYSVFVAISVFDVTLMDTLMPFGLNLAVFYGFGLIFFALFLALVYSALCGRHESSAAAAKEDDAKANWEGA